VISRGGGCVGADDDGPVVMDGWRRTSREHRFFLAADLASNNLGRWHWYDRYRHPIIQFQRLLRHVEYLDGRHGIFRVIRLIQLWRLKQLGMKLGFSVPRHVFGPGLSLAHYGSIVVNGTARVGCNARVHSCVNIGEGHGAAPSIGDNVYLGPGAKLFGAITIGDGAVIGANAVVNRDVPPRVVVGGVPARVLTEVVPNPSMVIDGCAVAASRLGYTIDACRKPPAKV
jgi:serine O-acetyltransferase